MQSLQKSHTSSGRISPGTSSPFASIRCLHSSRVACTSRCFLFFFSTYLFMFSTNIFKSSLSTSAAFALASAARSRSLAALWCSSALPGITQSVN